VGSRKKTSRVTRLEQMRLQTVDDYRAAWRCTDAGKGWIAYRDDVDFLCPPDVLGFDDDIWDGGVGHSVTEARLVGFLFVLQQQDEVPRPAVVDENASKAGVPGAAGLLTDEIRSMLEHEPHLFDHSDAGPAWRRLREGNRLLYATFVHALERERGDQNQKWGKRWVDLASKLLCELDEAKVGVLRTLNRFDPLLIERAWEYKAAAERVPARLLRPLKLLSELAESDSVTSTATRRRLEKELHAYEAFLAEYKRRRKQRFDEIADDDFQTIAGAHKNLLIDPRGTPSHDRLAERAVKAVFVSLADELINVYGVSERKAARLAGQVTCLLFPDTQERSGVDPFGKHYAKSVLNEYRYAKESRPSV